ncbi:MAG TPA: hypothetical protein VLS90_20825 [Thermodesulfobacteriota bacterium]|nr:hypothetical protein [Thermodesulfobacteriota bacterium]
MNYRLPAFFPSAKKFLTGALCALFLFSAAACGYQPSYLRKSEKTTIPDRWKVAGINPVLLSADEKAVLEKMGPPQYIRFFRRNSLQREKVYAWIYASPPSEVFFMNGKKADYVVVDDDLSSLNEYQKKTLFWGAIAVGAVAAVGGLTYYLFLK